MLTNFCHRYVLLQYVMQSVYMRVTIVLFKEIRAQSVLPVIGGRIAMSAPTLLRRTVHRWFA